MTVRGGGPSGPARSRRCRSPRPRGADRSRRRGPAGSRYAAWGTSIRTRTQWTFRSAYSDEQTPLPLQRLGFAIATDVTGALAAWRPHTISVTAPGARSVTLQISYDDGSSWQSAPLAAARALVPPHRPGWVSLRATATNADGGQVVQEVIRAYRLR